MISRIPFDRIVTSGLNFDVGRAGIESAFFAQEGNFTGLVCLETNDSFPIALAEVTALPDTWGSSTAVIAVSLTR
jgi:hypothetical protein